MPALRRPLKSPQNLLVILPTWVGDFVMATPTLRTVRQRFADARITFLMHPNLGELVAGGDWMDECVEWPPENAETQKRRNAETEAAGKAVERTSRPATVPALVRLLRQRQFDVALLLPNSFRAAVIAWLSGARRRIGYARDGRSLLLTDRLAVRNRRSVVREDLVPASHRAATGPVRVGLHLPVRPAPYVPMPLVEYYADLAEAIGCDRPGDRLELFTTSECDRSVERRLVDLGLAGRSLVVLSPGARFGASKCWMPERFAEVADRLTHEFGTAVVVTCGPGEEPIARAIGSAMRGPATVLDHPPLTLGEVKSLIRRCDLWIGNDAGPRHIAKAFGVPTVTIFGPTHPDWTSTSYADERIVRIDVDCGPCQQRVCPLGHHQCMTGVSADAVVAAATELLRSRTGQHVAAR